MYMIEGAHVLHGDSNSDTCILIVGAEHGNEPAGILAIERTKDLIATGDWNVGCTILGLIGNPRAVEQNVRFVDENLNRAFGGHSSIGTYEHSRALAITEWIEEIKAVYPKLYVLDLHSVSVGETRMVICTDTPKARELAYAVSPCTLRITIAPSVMPGTFMHFVESIGGAVLVAECGNHESPSGVTVAMEHVERLLEHLGLLSERKTTFKGLVTYEGEIRTYALTAPIKPHIGFEWTLPVASEFFLNSGTVYARDIEGERVASEECYIVMPSKKPEHTDFDAGFLATKIANI